MDNNTAYNLEYVHAVDAIDLETRVKAMYHDVATQPEAKYHFEMGRKMAERLGYPSADLGRIPYNAIDSFAGVGYYFDMADIKTGEAVVDLGSGSGMDTFIASLKTGESGAVTGVDMTRAQLQKSESLRKLHGINNVNYVEAYIDATTLDDEQFDVAISNGVINLSVDKPAVFREAARILKPGGRIALADIVTEKHLPDNITCDATLWAACIGGAAQEDDYADAIRAAGFKIQVIRENDDYWFISDGARWATDTFGVKSISLLAVKE